jgi:hypothetical protein
VNRAAVLLLAALAAPALAAPIRLDDSASPRVQVPAQVVLAEDGRRLADAPFARSAQVRFGQVQYRLATAAYLGRSARIYFVTPQSMAGLMSPAGLRVEWRGNRFASGSATAGQRTLVWSGVVAQPWMTESLELAAFVDLRHIRWPRDGQLSFDAYFEIEVHP